MDDHGLRVYDSILGLLSDADNPTPLVRLSRVTPFRHTQVYGKLEWYNPFGAVKDRVAANLVADGEARQTVGEKQKLVEPTSGNTGMALAMIANAKGYSLTTPLSSEIPLEKRTMLRFFGADVMELADTLCPAPGAPEGAIATAMEIGERPDFHMLNQYVNEANPEAHYKTTGPEIWRQTGGPRDALRGRSRHLRHHHGHRAVSQGAGQRGARARRASERGARHPGRAQPPAASADEAVLPGRVRRAGGGEQPGGVRALPAAQPRGEPRRRPQLGHGPGRRVQAGAGRAGQRRGGDLSRQRLQVRVVGGEASAGARGAGGEAGRARATRCSTRWWRTCGATGSDHRRRDRPRAACRTASRS